MKLENLSNDILIHNLNLLDMSELKKIIPYGTQSISSEDVQAVVDVLRGDWLTQGPAVPKFEAALTEKFGVKHAVAVNSATSALHIACLALGIGRGDLVWTVPNTFVASANCALYCGADIDFVDIDSDTLCISSAALEEKLIKARATGSALPKVVIPVHFGGQSCDMASIHSLAVRFGFHVIEDASHAIGATHQDQPVGNCRYSDIAVFSFHPVKIITTGEGGMAVTNNAALAQRMSLLRSHGVTRDPTLMEQCAAPAWHYEQLTLGFNYRMTDLQAALGLSQLDRLNTFVELRRRVARRYDDELASLGVRPQVVPRDTSSARHLYIIHADADRRDDLFAQLRDAGIGVNVHYTPVYLHPYYRQLGFAEGLCPNAEAHGREALSLPIYPDLEPSQQDYVITTLTNLLNQPLGLAA
jgi:UDP-4-amino-4,6-dideoxy-N-acetyl-beta-L-altrosamine transaminase